MIDVRATGGYSDIVWSRSGSLSSSEAFPTNVNEFTHFNEIFIRYPTSAAEFGAFEVAFSGQEDDRIAFLVIPAGMKLIGLYLIIVSTNSHLYVMLVACSVLVDRVYGIFALP